jgi:hypothetical protein
LRSDLIPVTGETLRMGKAASFWLSPGRRGKVLAAVSHAVYLLLDIGELVWLANPESPLHRRCIRWPIPLTDLAVEAPFVVQDHSICFATGTKLDLYNSEIWESPLVPVHEVIEYDKLPGGLFDKLKFLLSEGSPRSFGEFIRPIVQLARTNEFSPGFRSEDIFLATAWPMVETITRTCLSRNFPVVLQQADALIGLGEGLTPSGDDFLGGLFYACFLLSSSFPLIHFYSPADIPGWVDAHRSRTNLISFALLRDNAAGHALEPLSRFGIALLANHPLEDVTALVSDLVQVGHSTGWSVLAGFITGLLSLTS